MKTKFLFFLLFIAHTVNAQIINIPDFNFKSELLKASPDFVIAKNLQGNYFKIDLNGDGEIQTNEAENVSELYLKPNMLCDYKYCYPTNSIGSLEGIKYFKNLISFSIFLTKSDFDFSDLKKLKNFSINNTLYGDPIYSISSLNLTGCSSLENLQLPKNVAKINLNGCSSLSGFSFTDFSLRELTLSGCTNLKNLVLNAYLKNLDLTDLKKLEVLKMSQQFGANENLILKGCANIKDIICSNNQIKSLDVSSCSNLTNLDCRNNYLVSLNIKNGTKANISFSSNPNLVNICCDEIELNEIIDKVKVNGQSAEVNSFCAFVPNDNFNTITGTVKFDVDFNGCDSNDFIAKNIKMKISDGTNLSYTFTDDLGNYTFYTQSGNFTIAPILENPYFTTNPIVVEFLDANNNEKTQDFCFTSNGIKNDLEVKLIPTQGARVGEEANYKLIYKNKGTTVLTGTIILTFDNTVLDFISAVPPAETSFGNLSWNYFNLKPFETKSFFFKMKLNNPTQTPPLSINDVLNYTATINPIVEDETAEDNTFVLKQKVVGAYDPNDKTCLQGNSVGPEIAGKYIDYLIRFENEGTDYAKNIVVKDFIDTDVFDISTLQVITSSHIMRTKISNNNKVEFIFDNNYLPINELNKFGFVSFKIKTKDKVKLGDILKNKADIYFDFNSPELTNEVLINVEKLNVTDYDLTSELFYSNPVKDKITFNKEVQSVLIFDLNGRLLQNSTMNGTELNISHLIKGIYILKLESNKKTNQRKLIKE